MADRLPLTLQVYRLLTAAVGAGCRRGAAIIASSAARSIAARLPERRGESTVARPDGPLVWLHGASVGELLSILPLIERIRARDITVLVTAGTVTAAELAERRLPPGVIHQFVPLDLPQYRGALPRPLAAQSRAVRRIRSVAQPDHGERRARHSAHPDQRPRVGALVPPLAPGCRARSVPCSAASISALRNPPRTPRATPSLGAPRYVTTGNLKLDVPAPPADATQALRAAVRDRRASGDCRRLHASGRGHRTDRRASPAEAQLSRPADDPGAAASGARARASPASPAARG